MSTWTTGSPCIAPDEGLHEAVARTALFRPQAPALLGEGDPVTYGELDRTADAWAATLAERGAGPGVIVPIRLPRGTALVTALLAVLKTGAAYCLVDPQWPEPRLHAVLDVLRPPLLIAAADDRTCDVPVWQPPAAPARPAPEFRPAAVSGDDPCCVFFTSGTTGVPKGVLTTHRATARLFQCNGFAEFGPDSVVPLAAPVPWDAFSLELWSVLLNGGAAVVVTEPFLSAGRLREAVSRYGADTVWLTASLFNLIVEEDIGAFDGLRHVLAGGERLSPHHVRQVLRTYPDLLLSNGYGPVESVVFATTHRVREPDCDRPGGIPLGRPVPGTGVHVLDGERPCGVGEVGEICLSGDGLALRYLGDPAATDAAFRHVELDGVAVRVYRTGDLGRWDEHGLLHFCGRGDRQIKIRGHRVEPAEVERQVERLLPAVRHCRVLARRDDAGAAQDLVAFCVPRRPGDLLPGAADVLRTGLVSYQRPAQVLAVPEFPLTAQGKLDESALLGMLTTTGPGAREAVAQPRDPVARLVAGVFAAVLDTQGVPADASFFELGGGSLAAARVCARLSGELDRIVPLSWLYQEPTVTGLAGLLSAGNDGTAAPQPPPDGAAPAEVPLSPMQLVYLTKHLFEPDDRSGHCLLFFAVEGEPDGAALQAAVDEVHQRHEALQAVYAADPRPVAWPATDLPPPLLEELPGRYGSVEAAARALREEFADELDPTKGDVWRAAISRVDGGGTGPVVVFGCVVHHIAFDGWSESVLAADLATAYNRATGADATPPRPRPAGLAQVHRWSRQGADRIARQVGPAAGELADVPDLCWPAANTTGTVAGDGPPAVVRSWLGPDLVATVDAAAASAGVTRFVVLLAQWGRCVAELTGQPDFAVGVPVSERSVPGLDDVVGCHINTVPVRLRGPAARGDVRATGAVVRQAFARQDVPLADLLRALNRPRTNRPPLFQALFAVQDNAVPELELAGLRTTFLRQPYLRLPLELHTELWPEPGGGLRAEVSHTDAVPARFARELADRFVQRLHSLPRSQP